MHSVDGDLQQVAGRLTGLTLKRSGFALGVYGPPGIGKTHAVLALLRGAQCRSLTVHATQPLAGTLLRLPRPKKLSAWLERGLERLRSGETLASEALLQTLAGVLSANAPFILHVEDLHEASSERSEFWTQLALMIPRLRGVALIVTTRTQPPAPLEAMGLSPLTRTGSDALLEAEAGATLPREALEWIFEHAIGNPLFTLEFFRFLARQGALWNDGHRWRWRTPQRGAMPVTIEALIEQILNEAGSTPTLERALQARAVLGMAATPALWASVAELTPQTLELVSADLERLGVCTSGDFAHPLYCEVALGQVSLEGRRSLARRAIKCLKGDPRAAAGFVQNAGLKADEALEWFRRAALAAQRAGDEIQAAQFTSQAVQYVHGDERASLALSAARALRNVDALQAVKLLEQALFVQPDLPDAICLLIELSISLRRDAEVEPLLLRLEGLYERGLRWVAQCVKVQCAFKRYAEVLALWQANPNLTDQSQFNVVPEICRALSSCGRTAEARAIAEAGLAQLSLDANERGRTLEAIAETCFYQGKYLEAADWYAQSHALLERSGNLKAIASILYNRAMCLRYAGDWSQSTADIQTSIALEEQIGNISGAIKSKISLGVQWHSQGQYERAEELYLECLHELSFLALSSDVVTCEINLNALHLDWHSSHSALLAVKYGYAALKHAQRLGDLAGVASALAHASFAESIQGNGQTALQLADDALERASEIGFANLIRKAGDARRRALEALGEPMAALEILRTLMSEAETNGNDALIQHYGLEIDRHTNDLTSARQRLEWYKARGRLHGVHKALRYFPELAVQPAPLESSPARLEVLGTMQTSLEGTASPVRGRKRQELLALLLEARISGRGEVAKLELLDALYPDADELQASAGLRDVIYQLRSSLGDGAVMTTTHGYALGNLGSDVEDFLKSGDTRLWRGTYLQGLMLAGSDTVFESMYLALRSRAETLLQTDPAEAARVGRLLCDADPYDLEAVQLTLSGLRVGGNHRSLSRVYEQARTRFLEIGETLPNAWQDFLMPVSASD